MARSSASCCFYSPRTGLGATWPAATMTTVLRCLVLASLLTLTLSVTKTTLDQVVTYDGDKLITIDAPTEKHWQMAEKILHRNAKHGYDVWKQPFISRMVDSRSTPAHVHVNHRDSEAVLRSLEEQGFESKISIEDIGRVIQEQNLTKLRRKRDTLEINRHYARYDEILEWMDEVAQRYPEVARVEHIGKTHEGREMRVLKLGVPGTGKWGVWVDGGIHAREWVSSSTVIYLAQQLLEGYAYHDPQVTSYLRQLDWYILPVMNPDGYEYSHTTNRLWRKNRQPSSLPNCIGVDLNRNWAYKWGGANSESRPCDGIYRGNGPESELEVQAVVKYVLPRADALIAYLSYHSYGHKFLTPWAYTERELPPDHSDLITLAERATDAIRRVHGVPYMAGTAPQLIYPFAGGSADWAKGVAGIKYAYLLEIRDDGRYGFLLPPEQIVPTGEEHWAGVRVIAEDIMQKYGQISAPEVVVHKPQTVHVDKIVLLNGTPALAAQLTRIQCLVAIVFMYFIHEL